MLAPLSRADVAALDQADELAYLRGSFVLPAGVVYLDGNSLGALPIRAVERLETVVEEEWGQGLVRSWNDCSWIDLPQHVAAALAPLLGASPDEVVVADSTSVNLFKLLAAATRLRSDRPVILSETGNFPTDLYVAQGLATALGTVELRLVERDEIPAALDDRVSALLLTHVDFRTGETRDIERLTAAAHEKGALTVWDLSHSAGALPLELDAWGVDMAVGSGYKYLNGGPGAPAFAFVARDLHDAIETPLQGWMGHAEPFAFETEFRAAPGITKLLCGTPSILALTALKCGIESVARAGVEPLRRKSMRLTDLFIQLVEQECADRDLELASPAEAARRGSQVSYNHPEGHAIVQALVGHRVIGDFRPPHTMRFGFAPAYVQFVDVWEAVAALRAVLESREWDRPEHRRSTRVT